MKAWLLLVAAFLLWPGFSSQNEITCNSPRITNGSFRPQRTLYRDGDLIRILCDDGFTFEPDNGEKVVECTRNGWSPSPKCVRKGCDYIPIENGRMEDQFERYKPFPIWEGRSIQFFCYEGFLPKGKQTWQAAKCINSRYDPEPKCFKKCDPSRFYNGHFIYNYWSKYIEGDNITFVCDTGYSPANKQSSVTCTKRGWSPVPRCIRTDLGAKCGRPPPVENGDIVDIPKLIYLHSESVTYQCQSFYTMQGSARVTCQNGRWSQTPTCRVACTASQEDMREHNIRLRWDNFGDKIYSEDGNTVEFVCLRGYKQHPDTRTLRVACVDGKFNYPRCIPI